MVLKSSDRFKVESNVFRFLAIVTKDTFECGSAHIHVVLSSDCCCFTSLAILECEFYIYNTYSRCSKILKTKFLTKRPRQTVQIQIRLFQDLHWLPF